MIECPFPDCDHLAADDDALIAHLARDGAEPEHAAPCPIGTPGSPLHHAGRLPFDGCPPLVPIVAHRWLGLDQPGAWQRIRQAYTDYGHDALFHLHYQLARLLARSGYQRAFTVRVSTGGDSPEKMLAGMVDAAVYELVMYAEMPENSDVIARLYDEVTLIVLRHWETTDAVTARLLNLLAELPRDTVMREIARTRAEATPATRDVR